MPRYIVYELQKLSSRNQQVTAIQESLPNWSLEGTLDIDGVFGKLTETAVKKFQKESGLSADGVVGEGTATALGIWATVQKGFDASHWNSIFWDKVTDDVTFCNLKATEGATFADSDFRDSVKGAISAGLSVGAYHFTKFENSPFIEASNFLNAVTGYSSMDRLYLDLEYRLSHLSPEAIYAWVEDFLRTISGVIPGTEIGVYTSKNYMSEVGLQKFRGLEHYNLWAASWGGQPYVYPWNSWDVWQYTANGQEVWAQGDIDLNLMRVK